MVLQFMLRTIFVFSICFSFYPKVFAANCPNTPKLLSQKVTLNAFKIYGTPFIDSIDVEFWTRLCRGTYQLLATVTPKTPGKSTSIGYTLAIIQDGKQETIDSIGNSKNLYVSKTNKLITSSNSNINYRKPFQIILQCRGSIAEYCTASQKKIINMTPASGRMSGLDGAWYDPSYSGLGFNILQTDVGFFMYYYGYKGNANGQAQWLLSEAGPKTITKGKVFTLNINSGFVGNGANFIQKPTNSPGTQYWGTAEITFNSCQSGTIKLSGKDGTLTHNITKIIGPSGNVCND